MSLDSYRRVFLEAAPYLVRYRGAHFVLWISPEFSEGERARLLEDLFILNLLGVRISLFVGGEPDPLVPLTDPEFFATIKTRELTRLYDTIQILGRAWMGIPERRYRAQVTTGNLITLRRKGVVNGCDWGYAGELRSLASERIISHLDTGEILVFSGVLPGATGELLWGSPLELAGRYAAQLKADKLVFLTPRLNLEFPREWGEKKLSDLCVAHPSDHLLSAAFSALGAGVPRIHLVPGEPGGLLKELLSFEGYGVLFTRHPSTQLLVAQVEEVEEIAALLSLFEGDGALSPRSRERIESEIENYRVLKTDGRIVACGAVRIIQESTTFAFIEAIAVHPEFQGKGWGGALLSGLEAEARERGAERLYLFTTKARDWFTARGYEPTPLDSSPLTIRSLFQPCRGSTILVKTLKSRDRLHLL